ncbi:CGGC domain-containing protein [Chloroflexota bacterium]
MKVGIIRCDDHSRKCAGYNCFPAIHDKAGEFKEYDTVELVGFDSCGGCGGGKADRILTKAVRLKERGAEVIHLANCMVHTCPFKDMYAKAINKELKLSIVEKTHEPHPQVDSSTVAK